MNSVLVSTLSVEWGRGDVRCLFFFIRLGLGVVFVLFAFIVDAEDRVDAADSKEGGPPTRWMVSDVYTPGLWGMVESFVNFRSRSSSLLKKLHA